MGFKRRPFTSEVCAVVEVDGTPPQVTLRPGAAFHPKTGRVYVFGGDKPDHEVVGAMPEAHDRPIEQRNALYYLTQNEHGRLSWRGPVASEDPEPYLRNTPTGAIPRSNHVWSPAANPDYLMAQGGCYMACGVTYMDQDGMADWLAYDTRSNQWAELLPPIAHSHETWAVPEHVHRLPVLSGHSGVLDPITGRVLVLMAFEQERELPVFVPEAGLPGFVFSTEGDPTSWDFCALNTTGQGPSFRAWYSMTVIGRRMIVFGGAYQVFRHRKWHVLYPDDVCILDLDTLQWSKLATTGEKPTGRMQHGAVALDANRLLIIGGEVGFGNESSALTDAYVLDINNAKWTKLTDCLDTPPHATWVGFGSPGNVRVLALGGDTDRFQVFEFRLKR